MPPFAQEYYTTGEYDRAPACAVKVPMAQCRLFVRELRARGLAPERQLAMLGIPYADDDEGSTISVSQFEAFLRAGEELSSDPHLGLHAGAQIRVEDSNLLGLLMRSSPDGETAQETFHRYRSTTEEAFDVETFSDGKVVVCKRFMPQIRDSRILSEHFVARVVTMTRLLLGAVDPLEVRLTCDAPADLSEHRRILGDNLRFGESEDAVVFSASILSRPMLNRDPAACAVLSAYLDSLPGAGRPTPSGLTTEVRHAIQEELKRGRATMTEVATRLRISDRTLRRQLRALGTSFQRVLDEVRREEAIYHLRESRYVVSELSELLGFSCPAAFYRAFRRWTGHSPAMYRRRTLSNLASHLG